MNACMHDDEDVGDDDGDVNDDVSDNNLWRNKEKYSLFFGTFAEPPM